MFLIRSNAFDWFCKLPSQAKKRCLMWNGIPGIRSISRKIASSFDRCCRLKTSGQSAKRFLRNQSGSSIIFLGRHRQIFLSPSLFLSSFISYQVFFPWTSLGPKKAKKNLLFVSPPVDFFQLFCPLWLFGGAWIEVGSFYYERWCCWAKISSSSLVYVVIFQPSIASVTQLNLSLKLTVYFMATEL